MMMFMTTTTMVIGNGKMIMMVRMMVHSFHKSVEVAANANSRAQRIVSSIVS